MRPTLRQLEYLVAVSETLNFRQAAERCHVTQPALSAQLRELESALGVQLFERDRRHVLPTPAGTALAARAREVLRRSDELVELAQSFGEPLSGTLRLGVIPTVAPYLLPRVLEHAREAHPRLRLLLLEDQTHRLVERVEAGELDLLALALEADLGAARTEALFQDPFWLALPEGHPLAKREAVEEADLQGQTVLLLEEGHCLRAQALPLCARAGALEVGDFRASSLGTLLQMVAAGLGVTLVPEMALEREVRTVPGLVARPFGHDGPSRSIGLAWRASSPREEEFRLLGEALRTAWLG